MSCDQSVQYVESQMSDRVYGASNHRLLQKGALVDAGAPIRETIVTAKWSSEVYLL